MTPSGPSPTPFQDPPASPRVAETLCAMFTETLLVPVCPDDEIQYLATIDSLKLMRLITRIEDRFDLTLDDDRVFTASTVADIIQLVEHAPDSHP
jgi:acyl carrier protein